MNYIENIKFIIIYFKVFRTLIFLIVGVQPNEEFEKIIKENLENLLDFH